MHLVIPPFGQLMEIIFKEIIRVLILKAQYLFPFLKMGINGYMS